MSGSVTATVPKVGVALVDDHAVVRAALRQFISHEPDMQVIGECCNGREAIDLIRKPGVNVMVLDIGMPGQSGIDVMAMLRAKAPHVGIVILSGHPMENYAITMIKLGASAYLNKQCDPDEIMRAIRVVATGKRYLPPEMADLLAATAGSDKNGTPAHLGLTEREFQIFMKLAQGGTAEDIGEDLSLSPRTVSTYRSSLIRKLDLRTNSDLTYYALKHDLLQ